MKTNNITILGLQWGDEGKGKVVDCFAGSVDVVVRFGGGANAGHTVINKRGKFILHLLPSGMVHPGVTCFMGGGMVVDPAGLFEELEDLESKGINCDGRLFIDNTAQLVLPHHRAIEKYAETLSRSRSINTTLRGIGPTYADKANRIGITAGDLADIDYLSKRVKNFIEKKRFMLSAIDDKTLTDDDYLMDYLKPYIPRFKSMLVDVTSRLRDEILRNKKILFEGAQGSLLDLGLGTYPYVTSSNTTIGGLFTGLGMPPGVQGEMLGVVKAYTTRVGNGPFPTELTDATGEELRQKGGEYGATTGRPRRCGWLDLAITRRTAFMSGATGIVITKLDVLDGVENIKVCTKHRLGNKDYDFPSLYSNFMAKAEPVYQTLKGWKGTIAGINEFDKLPQEAKNYIRFIEKEIDVPVKYISTGSDRSAFIKIA